MPDGMATQEMCPREIPLFPVFQRFPKYYGFRKIVYGFRNMFTVSEICLRFPKYINVSRCNSTPRVQYHSIRGTTGSLDSFPVRLRVVQGVFGGIPSPRVPVVTLLARVYDFGGRRGSLKNLWKTYNNI
jgi:hypothetical protein